MREISCKKNEVSFDIKFDTCKIFFNVDMNAQADSLIDSGQFDGTSIQERRQSINERYERVKNLASHRQARLNEANTLHQFFRDIADEESWIKCVNS